MAERLPGAGRVVRLDLGCFVRPGSETGTGAPRVEPVLAYLVEEPGGWLLFDTGIGTGPPDFEAHYRPARRALDRALHDAGVERGSIRWIANCHLHIDHCGDNPAFAGLPVFVQRTELQQARSAGDYTLPALVDFDGARYEELAGETEILAGTYLLPTPGHTDGHQSLVVRRDDGTVVVAGQARDHASDLAADVMARRAAREGIGEPLPGHPEWLERLERFDPSRVVFAHDLAVWEPL